MGSHGFAVNWSEQYSDLVPSFEKVPGVNHQTVRMNDDLLSIPVCDHSNRNRIGSTTIGHQNRPRYGVSVWCNRKVFTVDLLRLGWDRLRAAGKDDVRLPILSNEGTQHCLREPRRCHQQAENEYSPDSHRPDCASL